MPMIRAGDVVGNEDMTETLRFIKTAADTNGELLEMEATYKPGGKLNPNIQHYHPSQDERFEVASGSISTLINGQERIYSAGEAFDVPRGTVHIMANVSEEPAVVLWQVRPAMVSEDFLATVWSEAYEKQQNLLQLAVLVRAYNPVFRLAKPAYPVQVVVFGFMALIGRLRGYRPTLKA